MRPRSTVLITAALTVALAVPAAAVTSGEPDGDGHPAVGQLIFHVPDAVDPRFDDPGSWFNCSGTLVSDTVVVTAGHCTYAIGVNGQGAHDEGEGFSFDELAGGTDVWFTNASVADYAGLPPTGDDPTTDEIEGYGPDENDLRYDEWEAFFDGNAGWTRATAHSHPDYVDAAFFLFDLGVLVLDEPITLGDGDYGQLPEEGQLDALQTKRRNDALFTVVGYGINQIVPTFESFDTRYVGTVRLLTTNGTHGIDGIQDGTSVVFSNNNGRAARGGTCFGDSGGPAFVAGTTTLVAVTSYGVSPNCTGTGGGYRIDKALDLGFINGFLAD